MTVPGEVARETMISVVINMVLSAVFFVLVSGLHGPVRLADIGPDLVPQAFMVTLMGSLVPGLLTAPRHGVTGRTGAIVGRSFAVAFIAAIVVGGGGILLLHGSMAPVAYGPAFAARVALGGILSVLVTPFAVRRAAPRAVA